jgi:hypothetical protein
MSALRTDWGWSLCMTIPIMTQYTPIQPGTFEEFIQALPAWEGTILEHVPLHCNLYTLHNCLQTRQACISVSDGLVQGERGAFGWCLRQMDSNCLATGMGPTQGWHPVPTKPKDTEPLLSVVPMLLWMAIASLIIWWVSTM